MWTYTEDVDGCPTGNLVLDHAGNAYGVTQDGGPNGWGSVLELSPSGSTWTETILYAFQGEGDGGQAVALGILARGGAAAVDVQGRHAVVPVAGFLVEEQLDP